MYVGRYFLMISSNQESDDLNKNEVANFIFICWISKNGKRRPTIPNGRKIGDRSARTHSNLFLYSKSVTFFAEIYFVAKQISKLYEICRRAQVIKEKCIMNLKIFDPAVTITMRKKMFDKSSLITCC